MIEAAVSENLEESLRALDRLKDAVDGGEVCG